MRKEIQFLLYSLPNEEGKVQVVIKDETLWCTQKAMAQLFGVGVPAISKHLKNIFEDGKLSQDMTISKTETTTPQSAMDDKFQTQKVDFYHLDAVIAVRRATAIRAKVMASETGRASQMPGVPARWGMRIKDGTRKTRPRANEYVVAGSTLSTLWK